MSQNSNDPKIQVRLDPTTKDLYKILCIEEGTTMQEDIKHYIEKRLIHAANRP